MVPPRFELGSREPESHMLPLHHGTFSSYKSCLPFTIVNCSFQYSVLPLYIPPTLSSIIQTQDAPLFIHHPFFLYTPRYALYLQDTFILSTFPFSKKTPPVGLEPTTLRFKAARSTDWARKALTMSSWFFFPIQLPYHLPTLLLPFTYFIWQRGRVV